MVMRPSVSPDDGIPVPTGPGASAMLAGGSLYLEPEFSPNLSPRAPDTIAPVAFTGATSLWPQTPRDPMSATLGWDQNAPSASDIRLSAPERMPSSQTRVRGRIRWK